MFGFISYEITEHINFTVFTSMNSNQLKIISENKQIIKSGTWIVFKVSAVLS
jgi:hypothetical protein